MPGLEDFDPTGPADDGNPFGTAEPSSTSPSTSARTYPAKQAAIACHASQVTDTGVFLAMTEEVFARAFSTEWYIEPGRGGGLRDGWLLEGIG